MKTLSLVLCLFATTFDLASSSELKDRPINPAHFSVLGITIGDDSLKTVQAKLGPAEKCRGKGHDGADIVVYADSRENLAFEFGEIGGGDITGFYLSRLNPAPGCAPSKLTEPIPELATKAGVHLGMKQADFLHTFGPPTNRNQNVWKYDLTREEKYSAEERKKEADAGTAISNTYLVGITIEARFSKGVLQYFFISKVEAT